MRSSRVVVILHEGFLHPEVLDGVVLEEGQGLADLVLALPGLHRLMELVEGADE
jgi:hypothetical protein